MAHVTRRFFLLSSAARWAARESTGSYYLDDSLVDQPYNENGFRRELLEFIAMGTC